MSFIVYTYKADGECHAYGSFDSSADAQAGVPFDEVTARGLADSINGFTETSGVKAMALPLEQTLQPGV